MLVEARLLNPSNVITEIAKIRIEYLCSLHILRLHCIGLAKKQDSEDLSNRPDYNQ